MFMFLIIIALLNLITNCFTIRVSSYCGDPGLPPDGYLSDVNSGRIRFQDGEEVTYRCSSEFHTFPQKRKCVSGRWTGNTARCGVPIKNEVQLIQVFNCSDNQNITTNEEIFNSAINQSENKMRLDNAFYADRHMSGPIYVKGSNCYRWKLKFKKPAIIPFLGLDFATKLTESDKTDGFVDQINATYYRTDLISVEPFVSPYRVCRPLHRLDFINSDPETNITYLINGYYFRCDSIDENDYKTELRKKSHEIVVQTRTDSFRDIYLVAVFLAGHKIDPKTGRPNCGKPETVRTGANYRESNSGISQFQFQCNTSFTDVTPNKPFNHKSNQWYSMNCSVNGLWEGLFPHCIPKIQCPGINYLEEHTDPSVMIESIENVYYLNDTDWVAGWHSQVNYACIDPEHIVVGKLTRTCLKNGMWSSNIPKCTDFVSPNSLPTVAQSPWTVILILSAVLLLFFTLVFLIVHKYISNMRKELMKYRNKSRNHTSVHSGKGNSIFYLYDDIDNNNRFERRTKRVKYNDTEYIELEGIGNTRSSTEPLYIPIIPSTP